MASISKIKIDNTTYDLKAAYDSDGDKIVDTYVLKEGDTMTGTLNVPTINNYNTSTAVSMATGTHADSYFQSRKFRGEGNVGTYYHAIDFGYANHNQVDFYEYGGVYNFWKNTSSTATTAAANLALKISLDTLSNKSYTYTWPNKTGTFALTSDLPTVNDGVLTIQANGTDKGTFSSNQSESKTINITAADMGLSSAMKFGGVAKQSITEGGTENADATSGNYVILAQPSNGTVYLNKDEHLEYVWVKGSSTVLGCWELLGQDGSYALSSVKVTGIGALGGGGTLTKDLEISHGQVTTNSTSSSEEPGSGGTFTALSSVSHDIYGHLTSYNVKTVTMPTIPDSIKNPNPLSFVGECKTSSFITDGSFSVLYDGSEPDQTFKVAVAHDVLLGGESTKLATISNGDTTYTLSAKIPESIKNPNPLRHFLSQNIYHEGYKYEDTIDYDGSSQITFSLEMEEKVPLGFGPDNASTLATAWSSTTVADKHYYSSSAYLPVPDASIEKSSSSANYPSSKAVADYAASYCVMDGDTLILDGGSSTVNI